MTLSNEVRNTPLDRVDKDDLVALAATARLLREEYEHHSMEAPDWLDARSREITRRLRMTNADEVERRIAEKRRQLEGLETPTEKRKRLEKELAELQQAQGASV